MKTRRRKSFKRSAWGKFYQSQGWARARTSSNHCGPASIAMVLNLIQQKGNQKKDTLSMQRVKDGVRLHAWERIPEWVPGIGGATAPWGMVRLFNSWAKQLKLGWSAERISHAKPELIFEQLEQGNQLSTLRLWENGGAHWSNLLHISTRSCMVYLLDPDPALERTPNEKKVRAVPWEDFLADWGRQPWWARLLGLKNELILYRQEKVHTP